jgi:hypothetical protein
MNPFPPIPASHIPEIAVYRAPCQYESTGFGEKFLPQWTPNTVSEATDNTTDAKPE